MTNASALKVTRMLIRAKWLMDGAKTLAECAGPLQEAADELGKLEANGWRPLTPVEDDYGEIIREILLQ